MMHGTMSLKSNPNPHIPVVGISTTAFRGKKKCYIFPIPGICVFRVSEQREIFPYILLTEWIL